MDANDTLHEVFGGTEASMRPDEETATSEDGGGGTSEDDGSKGGGGDGSSAAGSEKRGGSAASAPKRPAPGGGAASAPAKKPREGDAKTRAPPREGSQRKAAVAAGAFALLEEEAAAAKAARAEQKQFQAEVLRALQGGPAAQPLHAWVETLDDPVVEWLVKEKLLNERFTTDGCTARALTREERETNGINLKVHKRLLEYGVVLDK